MLAEMQQPLAETAEDLGLDEPDSGPVRRCLVSGERLPKEELLRLVVGPDGALVPDLAERLPGRGLWIRPRRELVETAVKRRLFARAAKAPVTVPADLAEQLGRLLRRRTLERIGLAKRAGALAVGHDQVRAVLDSGRALSLIQASDGSISERDRIAALGRGRNPGLVVWRLLGSAELGEALGRATAVHLAVTDARMAARLDRDLRRLADYETTASNDTPDTAPGAPVE
ncbi:LSU ribosomal protein L7AE [Tistlia consotensis]|uniref:LSU ribosomal protein L7AE n=1 Tax=Tistlia consotensis USBA 355 TaxID=560819 RepID=A0A1Y6CL30_9PROT|nr:RNA-binding protein [Tistlia consotensis]SMF74541.1 LSU ribosomal protein L7AE [Tistlia consotensis USBA 355]SNS10821.1 LSU ribosomal protein L7AE [Tistlia consotensis]